MKDRLEPYARRFAFFMVPGPEATPQEVRRRGRIIGAVALAIIVTVSMIYAYLGSLHQQTLIADAVQLRNAQTCQRVEHHILIACLDPQRWTAAGPEVQQAWVAGQAYTNPTVSAIHVVGPGKQSIYDQVIRAFPPAPHHT